ncbi:Neuron navigator 2 [Schistosoma japonicum]|nr:Neuron navigator 2 [Schistosoma japonicum]
MLPTPRPVAPYCQPTTQLQYPESFSENRNGTDSSDQPQFNQPNHLNIHNPRVISLNKNDKVYSTNSLTSSNLFYRASSLSYRPLTVSDADFINPSCTAPNTSVSNNRSSLYTSHKKLYGISNSVSSHEIANTCTVTIENNNNKSIHSEFPNSHINKIRMFKPETSVRSPSGYSCVSNEKFGDRPQLIGLHQSNPILHDQKGSTLNISQIHSSQHSTSLSPDINREKNSKNKLYFKKRHGTFDNNQKNTSNEVSLAPQNITNTNNIAFKSDNFKTHPPYVQSSQLRKSGPRTSSRDNSKEQSPAKLSSDKQTHSLIHNILASGHESLKNGVTLNQYKYVIHSSADSSNIPSQIRSSSTPSKTLPLNDLNRAKQVVLQKYHDPQISNLYSGLHTTHEKKLDDSSEQTLLKTNVVHNTVSPSILLQRTERLNGSSVLVASGKDTLTRLTNQSPSNASGNNNTPKSCEYTYSKDTVNSGEQSLTNDLGVNNQLQDLHSQGIHKQKTKHRSNLPNSNSAASSLSAGEDRTFCDSGISSSSYSKDSACTSPSDPNVYNSPVPSIGINEWVSKCTVPCVKELLHEPNSHQKHNQELSTSTSRIPSISKSLDKFEKTNFTEIVDIQQNLSITQRPQRPKTIGKLLPQSSKEVISVNPNNNDNESQNTSLKCCQGVNSLKKSPHSIQHPHDNRSSTLYSAQVSSNTSISKRPTKTDTKLQNNEVMRNEKISASATNNNNTSITETTVITPNQTYTYAYPYNNYKGLHPSNHNKSELPKLTEKNDIGCNQLRQMHIINEMGVQHDNHQHFKLLDDQPHKTSLNRSSLASEGDKSKVKRDSGKSTILYNELSSKTTYSQLSKLINTGEINSYLKPSNADEVISKPQELSEESDGVQKKVSTINLVESNVSTSASETGFLSKSLPSAAVENLYDKPADSTNDPDLLLSSLSKLTCGPCLEDNSWDRNYFSDVESEYAALELILPIPKRESLTEAETALELDKRLSADNQHSKANHLSDALVNLTNRDTSMTNNMIYHGNCLEPGYFSDTEAIFSSQRKFKPLPDPSTFNMCTTNNCKLPIASVAPIMSTQPVYFSSNVGDNQNCLLTSQNLNTGKRELSSPSHYPTKVDRTIQILETKWPRLCSLQNLVHSSHKDRLRHVSNQQEEINKNAPLFANNTVGTGPLSQVKLPYPTVSIMSSLNDISMKSGMSFYDGHRKDIHNTCFDSFQYKASGKLLAGDLNADNPVVNTSSIKSANLLIENVRQETKRLQDDIAILSAHLSMKDNTIETLEETMENLLFRIEQLQALDNLKSSEIHELQSIINQLRGDDLNSKSLANSPSHFNPRPPRSTSCRTLPDAMYQDLQDAISLSSFTSGTSGGSQEPSMHLLQQQHQNQQQQIISNNDSKCSSHIVNSSPSASDNERSNTKHSRWLRASFSKAFRKKTKCNIPVNDSEILMNHSTTTSLQPTLPDQISMNSPKSQYEQQLERLHLTVSRMRWQMDLLEARNKKLQEIILKYNRDEILLHELYTITPERKVTLHDLLTHYCQNASQTAQVFVSAESLYQNSLDKSLTKGQNRNHLNVNTDNAKDTPLNCIRSFKIGCIGVSDNMSWEELDERLHKLIQYCIDFLDPNNQLQLESLDLRTYQLNFTFTEQCEIKTHNVVRCLTATTLSSSTNDNQSQMPCTVLLPTLYAGKQISSESPIMWINDMINKSNAKHYTISIQVHLKGGTMKFPLERNQKVFERNEMLKYVCFGSLIPMTTLNTYLSIINDNLVVIISGPSGTGKSNLVNELAKLLVKDPYNTNAIYNFWFKHDGSTTLKELKEILTQQLHSYTNHGYPEVINLLNIHYFQESLCDALSAVKYSSNCPKIIGTSGYGNTELEKVCINSQIKIINHLSDVNDAKDYLERSLNRKLLQYRLFSRFYSLHGFNEDKDALNEFLTQAEDKNLYQLVSWLLEFWNQLNEIPHSLIQTSQFTVFGIRAFLTCPMHSQLSLNWFLDLWNNMLVPILFKDIKYVTVSSTPVTTIASEKLSNISKTLNNFLGWITTTWPWNPTIVNFPTSIKEPKITLTQNSVPVIKNIQPVLSTLSSSDIEICQHRTSMDSGIILDGINPTNFNFFNGFENNSNMLYSNYYYNHYYYYPYGIGENFDTQQDTIITSDFNQLNPTSYRYQNARNNCSKTVTSMN